MVQRQSRQLLSKGEERRVAVGVCYSRSMQGEEPSVAVLCVVAQRQSTGNSRKHNLSFPVSFTNLQKVNGPDCI